MHLTYLAVTLGCCFLPWLGAQAWNVPNNVLDKQQVERPLVEANCVDYVVAQANDHWVFVENSARQYIYCTPKVDCPEYVLARCLNKEREHVFKVLWDIRNGAAVFLPIEFRLKGHSQTLKRQDYDNALTWNNRADNLNKVDISFEEELVELAICGDYSRETCQFLERVISNGYTTDIFRMFVFKPIRYKYFLPTFDMEEYGTFVFNVTFSENANMIEWPFDYRDYTRLPKRNFF